MIKELALLMIQENENSKNHFFSVSDDNENIKRLIEHELFDDLKSKLKSEVLDIGLLLKLVDFIENYASYYSLKRNNALKELSPAASVDQSNKLFIHVNDSYVSLSIDDIVKCEASGNYTYIHTKQKEEFLVSKPLKYYELLLGAKGFFRANRSLLVNMNFVQSIYKREAIVLVTNERITVSVRNKAKLTEFINKYV
ncbi:LytR/AlgR family response regulator transcription factor [Tenacibaculum sp. M341]|uniref:LytR/AlgR family response regulator transcription factor n=1 Tax=Tenacibaculum sp. M341 TaxID=2530339 RepID=UPI00104581A5|nr:LytTR family DNA-binding domain-containing protein [Tenacibaculum sp. M341]TCI85035.1 LytTR family transcriptional regulator [Tenacibaculum sp. M341]